MILLEAETRTFGPVGMKEAEREAGPQIHLTRNQRALDLGGAIDGATKERLRQFGNRRLPRIEEDQLGKESAEDAAKCVCERASRSIVLLEERDDFARVRLIGDQIRQRFIERFDLGWQTAMSDRDACVVDGKL